MVPARPGQAPSVRREARRGHEVGPAGQLHDARRVVRGRAVERDGDERVDRLPALERVVLADADQAVARRVEAHVRVAPATGRRERRRRPVRSDAQQPSRREVGDDDQVTGGQVRPAAVLVDAGPDVEPGRADVADTIRAASSEPGSGDRHPRPRPSSQVIASPSQRGSASRTNPSATSSSGTGERQLPYGATAGTDTAPAGVNPACDSLVMAGLRPALSRSSCTPPARRSSRRCWWPSASSLRRATSWSIASGTT